MLSTTELFVEHIISGILSLVWITAFMLCFTGLNVYMLPFVSEFWGLLAVVTTAIAYPIGIFVDTMADKLLESRNEKIKSSYGLQDDFSLMTLIHRKNDDNIRSYFTYNRFKTRIARSSAINFLMIGIAVPLFLLLRGASLGIEQPASISLVIFATFILLSAASLFIWKEVTHVVYRRASLLLKEMPFINPESSSF